ncbi:MAG: sugar nucleotide-binding protein [Pseudomonadota bacterium]
MSLLVFGESGQVGIDLQRQMGADAPYLILGRNRADLADADACAYAIRDARPAVVINLAALHDETLAQADEDYATLVNGTTPGRMAEACAQIGAPFIHVSTADVFDGGGEEPWKPTDTPNPINALGRSKLSGEDAIRSVGGAHVILRTSWVISAHGDNFMRDVLKQAAFESRIEIASDQISAPTCAYDLATACHISAMRVIEDKSLTGTYHYQSKPHVSLSQAAREIIAAAGLTCEVVDIETKGAEPKPLNTRLECSLTEAQLGLRSPDWRQGIRYILSDLGQTV